MGWRAERQVPARAGQAWWAPPSRSNKLLPACSFRPSSQLPLSRLRPGGCGGAGGKGLHPSAPPTLQQTPASLPQGRAPSRAFQSNTLPPAPQRSLLGQSTPVPTPATLPPLCLASSSLTSETF